MLIFSRCNTAWTMLSDQGFLTARLVFVKRKKTEEGGKKSREGLRELPAAMSAACCRAQPCRAAGAQRGTRRVCALSAVLRPVPVHVTLTKEQVWLQSRTNECLPRCFSAHLMNKQAAPALGGRTARSSAGHGTHSTVGMCALCWVQLPVWGKIPLSPEPQCETRLPAQLFLCLFLAWGPLRWDEVWCWQGHGVGSSQG